MAKKDDVVQQAGDALVAAVVGAARAALTGGDPKAAVMRALRAAAGRHPAATAKLLGLEAVRCGACDGTGQRTAGQPCARCGGAIVGDEVRLGAGAIIRGDGAEKE